MVFLISCQSKTGIQEKKTDSTEKIESDNNANHKKDVNH